MHPPLPSLPFAISNVYQGLAVARGVATMRDSGLLLSFEVIDEIIGLIKSAVKEVEIPWSAMVQVERKQGWFSDRLTITVNDLAVVSAIPNHQGARFFLEVNRRQRDAAREFDLLLRSAIAEGNLRALESALEKHPYLSHDHQR